MKRYLETLFRFREVFLIPVLTIPIIALVAMAYTGKQYEVVSSIWVQPSPFLDPLIRSRTTPSEIEAQALREWLATKAFRKEIMDRVGLTDAIRRGEWPAPSQLKVKIPGLASAVSKDAALDAGLDMIGDRLRISTPGDNLLRIRYKGKEPFLGERLVDETIDLYNEKALKSQAAGVKTGIGFYTRQVQQQKNRLDEAAGELRTFLELRPAPPPGEPRPADEEAALENLRRNYLLEQTLYESGLRRLEQVRTEGEAAISNRTQSFVIVDPPDEPKTTGFTKRSIVMYLMLGSTLGVALGLVPIVLLTWLDNRVRTRDDVERLVRAPLIVQVPLLPRSWKRHAGLVRVALAQGARQGVSYPVPLGLENLNNGDGAFSQSSMVVAPFIPKAVRRNRDSASEQVAKPRSRRHGP